MALCASLTGVCIFLLVCCCCCRSGAERARVGSRGDEELPQWDARVQVRHERQDRHRQAGESRRGRRHREEVTRTCLSFTVIIYI